MSALSVSQAPSQGVVAHRRNMEKCQYCREKKLKCVWNGPGQRDYSQGQKCEGCTKSNLNCGPNTRAPKRGARNAVENVPESPRFEEMDGSQLIPGLPSGFIEAEIAQISRDTIQGRSEATLIATPFNGNLRTQRRLEATQVRRTTRPGLQSLARPLHTVSSNHASTAVELDTEQHLLALVSQLKVRRASNDHLHTFKDTVDYPVGTRETYHVFQQYINNLAMENENETNRLLREIDRLMSLDSLRNECCEELICLRCTEILAQFRIIVHTADFFDAHKIRFKARLMKIFQKRGDIHGLLQLGVTEQPTESMPQNLAAVFNQFAHQMEDMLRGMDEHIMRLIPSTGPIQVSACELALQAGRPDVAMLILKASGPTTRTNLLDRSDLHNFVQYGSVHQFFNALPEDWRNQLEEKDILNMTPLMTASLLGDHPAVQTLLDVGADLKARDRDGNDSLMAASVNGDEQVVSTLLKHGADPNDYAVTPMRPLHQAAMRGKLEACKMLLDPKLGDRQASCDTRCHGQTADQVAMEKGFPDVYDYISLTRQSGTHNMHTGFPLAHLDSQIPMDGSDVTGDFLMTEEDYDNFLSQETDSSVTGLNQP